MITLIATAAVLSCGEARDLVHRIDSTQFSRKEYYELIDVVRDSTRPNCKIKPKPGLFRGQVRRMHPPYVYSPYYAHPGYRPGWRRPSIRFNYIGEPTFIFRF